MRTGLRNFLLTLGLVAAACAAAYGIFYAVGDDRAMHAAARQGDALAWLRVEFRLDDAQFQAIRTLHHEYSFECGRHCAAIMEARERRAPAAEVAALERVCLEAITGHFRRVAALMAPEQGERYLALVLPRVAGFAHDGAPSLRVSP
jgi:hypothetical protein